MTLSTALFIFAAQLLAYLVKGLIGFGNPLISAPILSMGLDNVVITPGTLLLDCPVNAWITWEKPAQLPVAEDPAVAGGQLLRRDPRHAAAALFHALGHQNRAGRRRGAFRAGDGHPLPAAGEAGRKDRPWLRLAVSAFSGVCAGLFGINMFIVAYLQRTARRLQRVQGQHVLSLLWGECSAGSDLSSHRPVHRPGAAVRPGVCSRGGAGHGAWRRGWGPGWKRKSSKRAPSSSSSWAASASS